MVLTNFLAVWSRAECCAFVSPGKQVSNEMLNTCRLVAPYGKEQAGQIAQFTDVVSDFCWQGWLARQRRARDTFTSKEGSDVGAMKCYAEAFPRKEPNADRLPTGRSHVRADIVCDRSDGSAVRLHPAKSGTDAHIRIGFLHQLRYYRKIAKLEKEAATNTKVKEIMLKNTKRQRGLSGRRWRRKLH